MKRMWTEGEQRENGRRIIGAIEGSDADLDIAVAMYKDRLDTLLTPEQVRETILIIRGWPEESRKAIIASLTIVARD